MNAELDHYLDLVGKVPAEKIAETAGVPVADVEAWLAHLEGKADQEPEKARRSKTEPKPKTPKPAPARPRKVAVIQVLRSTAISVEAQNGRRLRLPVPRSIYRGELARRYAALLEEGTDYRVLAHED